MSTFGRRGVASANAWRRPAPRSAPAIDDDAPAARAAPAPVPRRRALAPLIFGVALLALYQPFMALEGDEFTPVAIDLAPGSHAPAPAYVVPSGCPQRSWSVGEFLPRACIEPHRIARDQAEGYGLEAPQYIGGGNRHRWSGYRQHEWVRVGADAILIARPRDASGEILNIAPARFDGPHASADPASDPADYRDPPLDYLVRAGVSLLWSPLYWLAVFGFILFCAKRWPDTARSKTADVAEE